MGSATFQQELTSKLANRLPTLIDIAPQISDKKTDSHKGTNKMQARLVKSLAVAAIVSGAFLLHAKRPISASVDVAPTPIKVGAALGVTSSLTNRSKDAQAVSVTIEMRGPCGVTASRGYKVMIIAGGTDTVKASLAAPACPGNYEATMVLSDHDGSILGTANAHFQVLPRETAIAAGK